MRGGFQIESRFEGLLDEVRIQALLLGEEANAQKRLELMDELVRLARRCRDLWQRMTEPPTGGASAFAAA